MKRASKPAPLDARPISLKLIQPSPFQPRSVFDHDELKDMAASIKAGGVEVPILVRPKGKGFELVDGERRVRASKLAGLFDIPAIVKVMTDAEARERILVIEIQKVSISDLDRADALHQLVTTHGVSLDDAAARIGRSVSTVRHLLRMRDAPKVLRQAADAGLVPSSTVQAVARIPGKETRERVARMVLCGSRYWNGTPPTDADVAKARQDDREPLTYRETREVIQERCYRELKQAPFSRKSLDLVNAAGSCEACPKRAGNMRADDADLAKSRPDICTDVECFEGKVTAHGAKLATEEAAAGRRVLSDDEAKKLFGIIEPTRCISADWVDLGWTCSEDPKGRSYEKLLAKPLEDQITIAVDRTGTVHRLVPIAAAKKELRKQGIGRSRPRTGEAKINSKVEELRVADAAATLANRLVTERVEAAVATVQWPGGLDGMLRAMAVRLASCTIWACDPVLRRREHPTEEHGDAIASIGSLAQTLKGPALLGLFAELLAAQITWYPPERAFSDSEVGLWEAFGIDPGDCRKQAERAKGSGLGIGARVKYRDDGQLGKDAGRIGTVVATRSRGQKLEGVQVEWHGKKKPEWIGAMELELVPAETSAAQRAAKRQQEPNADFDFAEKEAALA